MTGTIVWYDEYAWAFRYRGLGSGVLTTWGGWVDPLARLAYNALFATAGLAHYAPYRGMAILANFALALAVYLYGRRLGLPWLAVGACLLLLLLGSSSMTVLMPLNSMNALGLASLPLGLLLLERGRRSSDAAAFAVLLLAMGFAGPVVVPVCVGLAAWLLMARPVQWVRLLVPGVPVGLFAAGRQLLPAQAHLDVPYLDNLLAAPAFVAELASAGAAGVAGLPADKGSAVLALLVVAASLGIPRLDGASRRRTTALVATVLAGWGVLALGRAHLGDAQSPRYVVLTVAPVLLVALELAGGGRARGADPGRGGQSGRSAVPGRVAALAGLLALSLLGNVSVLRSASAYYRSQAEIERAQLGALELALHRAPPDYRPDPRPEWPLLYVTAGDWRATIRRLGSPGFPPAELPRASAEGRRQADRILLELGGVAVTALEAGSASGSGAGCQAHDGPAWDGEIGPAGLTVRAGGQPVEVRFRRFADSFPAEPWAVLAPAVPNVLVAAPDASGAPWRAELRGGPVITCLGEPAAR